jgi:deoxyribose-phosphate aldolase
LSTGEVTSADEIAGEAIADYEKWHARGRPSPSEHSIELTPEKTAKLIDHTQLQAAAGREAIEKLCSEAQEYGFASVCVHSSWAPLCAELLADSPVAVCCVAGFAQGANLTAVKRYEAQQAIDAGVTEVDMVIHVGRLKDREYKYVAADIAAVADVCHANGAILKTIIETCLLTDAEKAAACALAKHAGADFVKTSTGFNGPGAAVEDVALMRYIVGPDVGVKAAGGIRTLADLTNMVRAGASRIGASAGIQIIQGLESAKGG